MSVIVIVTVLVIVSVIVIVIVMVIVMELVIVSDTVEVVVELAPNPTPTMLPRGLKVRGWREPS